MDYSQVFSDLKTNFPDVEIYQNHPLAPYTTLKIGGPADIFIQTTSSNNFKKILKHITEKYAEEMSFSETGNISEINNFSAHSDRSDNMSEPEGSEHRKNSLMSYVTILGNGSNVLISDNGIRGIVIKNSSSEIEIINGHRPSAIGNRPSISAQRTENDPAKYLDFKSLDYDESDSPTVMVKLASGVSLPYAVNYLISQGVTGLQWFAYIPSTIGGAVYGNIHGGKYHFSDYIDSIECLDLKNCQTINFKKEDLTWDYDNSYFQAHPELIILTTTLKLFRGDTQKAKIVVDAWTDQKTKVQPMNSAGSVFKNPKLEDCQRLWGEQKSTGWIIDQQLGWKGKSIGGAQISDKHANFIINNGNATAVDYLNLAKSVQEEIKARFGIELEMEIKLLGKF